MVSSSADPQPDDKDPQIELVLNDSEATQAIYPHPFKVVYTVTLHGDHLKTEFRVINTGDKPLEFTAALHGYFEVDHVSKARVKGLQGLKVLDKVPNPNNPVEGTMDKEILEFNGHVDSVFLNATDYVELDVGTGAAIAVSVFPKFVFSRGCFRCLPRIGKTSFVGILTKTCRNFTKSLFASKMRVSILKPWLRVTRGSAKQIIPSKTLNRHFCQQRNVSIFPV